ncbi:hypothetical protein [Noviherbaspirillum sedimenti]|uniref:Uncharacterized protein n=1 Tax=Noviherbaspirillum sedimenti TaxID=2320865 RepID=A0A3A3G514_9BURK|nr:hypothetical protein [Noviherbaspirillum sedimenti]RJG01869.1 hypothetical protein D3878_10005 [Noviherbaspirillum sedimenti]
MTIKSSQDQTSGDVAVPDAALGDANATNPSRRHFAKTGLGISGVILSLASRPVLGNVVCKSPSGFLSGNASTHGPQPVCQGRSPGYWKNHEGSWPIATDTQFSSVFTTSQTSVYAQYTFLQLLTPQQDDKHNLGMHLVAAYLNAVKGWTPFLTVETILSMFAEWQSKGVFSPIATVQWSAPDIVYYLKATQA